MPRLDLRTVRLERFFPFALLALSLIVAACSGGDNGGGGGGGAPGY